MFSEKTLVVAAQRQLSSDLGDEVVVLNVDRGLYFGMNPVAALVWSKLQEPATVEDLRKEIMTRFDVDEDTCNADLHRLLDNLHRNGLIEVRTGAAA